MDLIKGNNFVDDRGMLTFFNDFDFSEVKRMYLVRNHKAGFIRAWHGHKKEAKYVTVLQGSAIIASMPIDFQNEPGRFKKVTLSEYAPKIFYIPPGYYNGFKTLTENTILQFFSTTTIEEAKDDDYRETWDFVGTQIWEEDYR